MGRVRRGFGSSPRANKDVGKYTTRGRVANDCGMAKYGAAVRHAAFRDGGGDFSITPASGSAIDGEEPHREVTFR